MSVDWDAVIEEYRTDEKLRADTEELIQLDAGRNPVKNAYRRALLDGDIHTARKILLQKRIFRFREKARQNPRWTGFTKYLIAEEKKMDTASKAVTN